MSNEITVFNNNNLNIDLDSKDKKNDKIYGDEFWLMNYKVLFDRRGQRHWVSWLTELYLSNKGLGKISKDFPNNM